ncbi:uncharacterized protein JCM15063_003864 [Sporobolomyces koalae]|uniref:uncharacterized protein n=1 Tax=Sporobolomyces koalae TaxID=500713 RepID=UPI00316E6027
MSAAVALNDWYLTIAYKDATRRELCLKVISVVDDQQTSKESEVQVRVVIRTTATRFQGAWPKGLAEFKLIGRPALDKAERAGIPREYLLLFGDGIPANWTSLLKETALRPAKFLATLPPRTVTANAVASTSKIPIGTTPTRARTTTESSSSIGRYGLDDQTTKELAQALRDRKGKRKARSNKSSPAKSEKRLRAKDLEYITTEQKTQFGVPKQQAMESVERWIETVTSEVVVASESTAVPEEISGGLDTEAEEPRLPDAAETVSPARPPATLDPAGLPRSNRPDHHSSKAVAPEATEIATVTTEKPPEPVEIPPEPSKMPPAFPTLVDSFFRIGRPLLTANAGPYVSFIPNLSGPARNLLTALSVPLRLAAPHPRPGRRKIRKPLHSIRLTVVGNASASIAVHGSQDTAETDRAVPSAPAPEAFMVTPTQTHEPLKEEIAQLYRDFEDEVHGVIKPKGSPMPEDQGMSDLSDLSEADDVLPQARIVAAGNDQGGEEARMDNHVGADVQMAPLGDAHGVAVPDCTETKGPGSAQEAFSNVRDADVDAASSWTLPRLDQVRNQDNSGETDSDEEEWPIFPLLSPTITGQYDEIVPIRFDSSSPPPRLASPPLPHSKGSPPAQHLKVASPEPPQPSYPLSPLRGSSPLEPILPPTPSFSDFYDDEEESNASIDLEVEEFLQREAMGHSSDGFEEIISPTKKRPAKTFEPQPTVREVERTQKKRSTAQSPTRHDIVNDATLPPASEQHTDSHQPANSRKETPPRQTRGRAPNSNQVSPTVDPFLFPLAPSIAASSQQDETASGSPRLAWTRAVSSETIPAPTNLAPTSSEESAVAALDTAQSVVGDQVDVLFSIESKAPSRVPSPQTDSRINLDDSQPGTPQPQLSERSAAPDASPNDESIETVPALAIPAESLGHRALYGAAVPFIDPADTTEVEDQADSQFHTNEQNIRAPNDETTHAGRTVGGEIPPVDRPEVSQKSALLRSGEGGIRTDVDAVIENSIAHSPSLASLGDPRDTSPGSLDASFARNSALSNQAPEVKPDRESEALRTESVSATIAQEQYNDGGPDHEYGGGIDESDDGERLPEGYIDNDFDTLAVGPEEPDLGELARASSIINEASSLESPQEDVTFVAPEPDPIRSSSSNLEKRLTPALEEPQHQQTSLDETESNMQVGRPDPLLSPSSMPAIATRDTPPESVDSEFAAASAPASAKQGSAIAPTSHDSGSPEPIPIGPSVTIYHDESAAPTVQVDSPSRSPIGNTSRQSGPVLYVLQRNEFQSQVSSSSEVHDEPPPLSTFTENDSGTTRSGHKDDQVIDDELGYVPQTLNQAFRKRRDEEADSVSRKGRKIQAFLTATPRLETTYSGSENASQYSKELPELDVGESVASVPTSRKSRARKRSSNESSTTLVDQTLSSSSAPGRSTPARSNSSRPTRERKPVEGWWDVERGLDSARRAVRVSDDHQDLEQRAREETAVVSRLEESETIEGINVGQNQVETGTSGVEEEHVDETNMDAEEGNEEDSNSSSIRSNRQSKKRKAISPELQAGSEQEEGSDAESPPTASSSPSKRNAASKSQAEPKQTTPAPKRRKRKSIVMPRLRKKA